MGKEKTNKELLILQGMVNMYKKDNEQMAHDILSLKYKIGGYTTYTKRLKNEIANQKETIQETIRQRDTAYQTIYAQTERIRDKNSEIRELKDKLHIQENTNKECIDKLENVQKEYELLEEQYESVSRDRKVLSDVYYGLEDYLAKPWYKRIFIKLDTLLEDAD